MSTDVTFDCLLQRFSNAVTCRDPFPIPAKGLLQSSHRILNVYAARHEGERVGCWPSQGDPEGEPLKSALSLPPEDLRLLCLAAFQRAMWHGAMANNCNNSLEQSDSNLYRRHYFAIADKVLRRGPALQDEDFVGIFDRLADGSTVTGLSAPLDALLTAAGKRWSRESPPAALTAAAVRLAERLTNPYTDRDTEQRLMVHRIRQFAGAVLPPPLFSRDSWAAAARVDLAGMPPESLSRWTALLDHAALASGAEPKGKWLKEARPHIDALGWDDVRSHLARWFAEVRPPESHYREDGSLESPHPNPMDSYNADVLKGLVFMATLDGDSDWSPHLTRLAVACFRKIPAYGTYAPKPGNGCLYALSLIPGAEGISVLQTLRRKVRDRSAEKLIDRFIRERAERDGIAEAELLEITVPDFDMDAAGVRRIPLGDHTAVLTVAGTGRVAQTWTNASGNPVKSVPAAIKRDFAEDLKEMRQLVKEIQDAHLNQRDRLDALMSRDPEWDYPTWRKRYLDHPLVATLAARLIWTFDTNGERTAAVPLAGGFVDADGNIHAGFAPETRVRIWHPLNDEVESVVRWRERLEALAITQPFKQAHREIYLLTEAERRTGTYSNRFAAHFLRQHQFASLCRARGWRYALRASFQMVTLPPSLPLPALDLTVQFLVQDLPEPTNDAGMSLYLSTDQVRFLRPDGDAVPLDAIPPRVFTEVMRDVDLFVSVAGIGAVPDWLETGHLTGTEDYWREFAFGELTASAATRRAVLERLVPRLTIASRCSFQDRFLRVQGDLRSYRIHLGSSNILMEPGDVYLCIVADPAGHTDPSDRLFLPFEGDRMLSVILSKAVMLANDTAIEDESIRRQIEASL